MTDKRGRAARPAVPDPDMAEGVGVFSRTRPGLDRDAVLQVFGCGFVTDAANTVFVGGVGMRKTHLSHPDLPGEEGGPAVAEGTE